jgi:hypothetical protein
MTDYCATNEHLLFASLNIVQRNGVYSEGQDVINKIFVVVL